MRTRQQRSPRKFETIFHYLYEECSVPAVSLFCEALFNSLLKYYSPYGYDTECCFRFFMMSYYHL